MEDYRRESLERFRELPEECMKAGTGLYVTFWRAEADPVAAPGRPQGADPERGLV